MHTVAQLVEADLAQGLLPIMVHTVVGMSPYAYSDNMSHLEELCTKYGMVLSLDGPGPHRNPLLQHPPCGCVCVCVC